MKWGQFYLLASFIFGAANTSEWLSRTLQCVTLILAVYAVFKESKEHWRKDEKV